MVIEVDKETIINELNADIRKAGIRISLLMLSGKALGYYRVKLIDRNEYYELSKIIEEKIKETFI